MKKLVGVVVLALSLSACPNGAGKKDTRGASGPIAQIARLEQERTTPEAFKAFLADEDAGVRSRAVLALARLEHRSALDPLVAASKDADASVRAVAAFGLGQLDLAIDSKVAAHVE